MIFKKGVFVLSFVSMENLLSHLPLLSIFHSEQGPCPASFAVDGILFHSFNWNGGALLKMSNSVS